MSVRCDSTISAFSLDMPMAIETFGLVKKCAQDSKFDRGQAQRSAGEFRDMLFGINGQFALGERRRFPGGRARGNWRRMTLTRATNSRGLKGLVT